MLVRTTAVLLLAAALGACADAIPENPVSSALAAGPAKGISTSVDPASADIIGPDFISMSQAPTTATYTAQVSNALGPFYYYWSLKQCYYYGPEIWVQCHTEYWTYDEGAGHNQITVDIPTDLVEFDVLLEVREERDGRVTGVAGKRVAGPSIGMWGFGPNYGPGPFGCSRSTMGWYPHQEWKYEAGSWTPTGRTYRRNVCDGSREYKPEP